jgi:hypothetical protein
MGSNYLKAGEFSVKVIGKDGWEHVVDYLVGVGFSDLLDGGELRLEFMETEDLDVLEFFVGWFLSRKAYNVEVWLGSGKRGILFTECYVDSIEVDRLSKLFENRDDGVGVYVVLKYVVAFVIDRSKGKAG